VSSSAALPKFMLDHGPKNRTRRREKAKEKTIRNKIRGRDPKPKRRAKVNHE